MYGSETMFLIQGHWSCYVSIFSCIYGFYVMAIIKIWIWYPCKLKMDKERVLINV